MNPATALARVLVDELVRGGVRDVVLSPGSRSAPLALELARADGARRLRLHVRIDERSAGFLALGLSAGSGRTVGVVCTSGSAVANLHPAVVEAHHAHVRLLVLSADRPPELRGTGANQTIDQPGIFGSAVRSFVELGVPEERVGAVAYWRSVVSRACASDVDGPVHINVALREPLVPDGDETWCESLDGQPDGAPWQRVFRPVAAGFPVRQQPMVRGIVVVGHGATTEQSVAAAELAEAWGVPLLSEPTGNARFGPRAVSTYPLLLADPDFRAAHPLSFAVVVGKPGLTRSLMGWLRTAEALLVVDPHDDWADPTRTADWILPCVPVADPAGAVLIEDRAPAERDAGWTTSWLAAEAAARSVVDAVLDDSGLSEARIARDVVSALPDDALLWVGSSRPVRDVEAYARPRSGLSIVGNRGASGIDGAVSSAIGWALQHDGPSYALMGDLSFLHDSNGLILGPEEPRPDLMIVVVDNDGGGIFGTLEQAGAPGFERVFGTPHKVDIASLCEATGVGYDVIDDLAELPAKLADRPSPERVAEFEAPVPDLPPVTAEQRRRRGRQRGTIEVLHVQTNRAETVEVHRRVQAAVSAALVGLR